MISYKNIQINFRTPKQFPNFIPDWSQYNYQIPKSLKKKSYSCILSTKSEMIHRANIADFKQQKLIKMWQNCRPCQRSYIIEC
ncbi:hypothetical protein V6Z11_D12G133400 [Gossypium hirsutum]